MSLITRCPTCETMFRVVPDQLRVSEGWVRCGQCAEVFDATQNMVPPANGAAPTPPPTPPPSPTPTAPASSTRAASASKPSGAQPPPLPPPPAAPAEGAIADTPSTAAGTAAASPTDAWAASPPMSTPTTTAAQHLDGVDDDMLPDLDWLDAPRTDPQTAILAEDDDADPDAIDTLPPPELDFPPEAAPGRNNDAEPVKNMGHAGGGTGLRPSFLRDDRQPSIWQRPAVRLALAIVVLALLALLGMQFLVKERDRVAAMQPAMLPVLEALCTVAGCSIAPLRQIESIVIDSSSFSRVRGDDYRLGFSLKNTAPIAVAMPAIELSLTDPRDQAVIRRVIMPSDFGARSEALASASVWTGSLALTVQPDAGAQRVAGYRLLAFYP